jgi:peptide-methionine (S)-S-oxide reductase
MQEPETSPPSQPSPEIIDSLFQQAVTAIDTGDQHTLEQLLTVHPSLVHERLLTPGAWLREKIGGALDGFFRQPYLLWFVAEDPVRNKQLPANIAALTATIIDKAKKEQVPSLQEQLDYTLLLVAWSRIAHDSKVQIALMDVLIDAGASIKGIPNNALVNAHFAAAEHAIQRGAPLTLAAALNLGYF